MVKDELEKICKKLDACLSVFIVDKDGLLIESVSKAELDIEAIAAEIAALVKEIERDNHEVEEQDVRFVSVETDKFEFLGVKIGDNLLMSVIDLGEVSLYRGKNRFELRRSALKFSDFF